MKDILKIFLSAIPFLLSMNIIKSQANVSISEKLANDQLSAYNKRNIEAFLAPYSDSVKVFTFPNTLNYQGKNQMKKVYDEMFQALPGLHCQLVNRMVLGNIVIDQEKVTFRKDQPVLEAIAIYKVWMDKIQEVYFIRKN